jgi:S-adenosylmethionine/arginine decarboxylase-like enzyme
MWGKHAVINAFRCPVALISNKAGIHAFTADLVKRIDMVAYGQPMIQHFGEGNKAGFTLVQLIETSNITGHFCDETGDAYLDVFSCKDFSERVVEAVVREHFRPQSLNLLTLRRQAGHPMEAQPHCCLNLR